MNKFISGIVLRLLLSISEPINPKNILKTIVYSAKSMKPLNA